MPVDVTCDTCGKVFPRGRTEVRPHNFCSHACYAVYKRTLRGEKGHNWRGGKVPIQCAHCGMTFEVTPSQATGTARTAARKYCSRACWDAAHIAEGVASWRGGRSKSGEYISVYAPEHPTAVARYKREHRLVMERHLGRALRRDEHVHHIDGDKTNNDLSNLVVMSASEHMKLHRERERAARKLSKAEDLT